MRKIVVFLMLIVTLLGVSGCMNYGHGTVSENPKMTKNLLAEKKKNDALKYLTEKYTDDEFVEQAYSQSDWAYDYETIVFLSKKYNEKFSVYIEDSNLQESFYDNYYTLYMKTEAEKYYYDMCEDLIGNKFAVKVRFNDDNINDSAGKISFEEYIENFHSNIDICFIISSDLDRNSQESIINRFIEKQYSESICFYMVGLIDTVESMSYDEVVNGGHEIKKISRYIIKDDFTVTRYN